MPSDGKFSDRIGIAVPGDGQDEPADDDTTARTVSDPSAENWGDLIQTAFLDDIDDRLVEVGSEAGLPNAGTDAPRFFLIDDAGESSDQPYLRYNDDTQWHDVTPLGERTFVDSGTTTTYNVESGESVWVDAGSASVDVVLNEVFDRARVRVIVINATNDVNILRDSSETLIDGEQQNLTLSTESVVELESDGSNWRKTADFHDRYTDEEAQDAVGTIADRGIDYNDSTPSLELDVIAAGQVNLSSGVATISTGINAASATFMLALGIDDPDQDAEVAGRMFWDDSADEYKVRVVEPGDSPVNPTVNYDIVRVR